MAHILEDRVLESSTTTGTGDITLAGAVTGFRAFSAVCAVADTVPYFIEAVDALGQPTGGYEYGTGTYSGANTLTRTTVLGSSNAGAAVNFPAGSKNVGIGLNKTELARVKLTGMTPVTVSGTTVDFTSIPDAVRRITISFRNVSTNGTDALLVQLGDSGGIEATGYAGIGLNIFNAGSSGTSYTAGFGLPSGAAANVMTGSIVLTLVDPATNLWVANGNVGTSSGSNMFMTTGSKALSAALDRVRITTLTGVDTFDGGSIGVLYERGA